MKLDGYEHRPRWCTCRRAAHALGACPVMGVGSTPPSAQNMAKHLLNWLQKQVNPLYFIPAASALSLVYDYIVTTVIFLPLVNEISNSGQAGIFESRFSMQPFKLIFILTFVAIVEEFIYRYLPI